MTPAETYAARIDAVQAQNLRIYGPPSGGDHWAAAARQFRFDPRRELDRNMVAIASYVQPDDIVVDVGGGAGRVGLPLALRCGKSSISSRRWEWVRSSSLWLERLASAMLG